MAEKASQGSANLSIVDASLDFTHKDGIRVVVREARLRLEGNVPVEIILPRVEAPLDGGALLGGSIHFESLKLDRPKIVLGLPAEERELPEMAALMEAIDRVADVVDEEFARRNLAHVEIDNGEVDIAGAMARSFVGIDAVLTRQNDRRIDARARVAGRAGSWEVEMTRRPAEGEDQQRRLAFLLKDITIGELLSPDREIRMGKGLGLPLSVRFDSRFDSEGRFSSASLVGRASDGWFQLGRTTVRFDDVALSLAWRSGTPGIEMTTSHAIYGNTQIFFNGHITPPETPGQDWGVKLATERAQFGSSDVPLPPIMIDKWVMDGRYVPASRTFFIDKTGLSAGPAKAFASGSVEIRADGPYLAVAMEAENFPIGLTKQIWPITLVPPARRWIIDRVVDGHIDNFQLQASVRPPAFNPANPDPGWSGNDMMMQLAYSGAQIRPVGEVPDVSGIHGTVTIADEILTVGGFDGVVRPDDGPRVDVPEGTFKILRLRERDNKLGVLDIQLGGGAKQVAEVFNSEPFRVLERVDIDPQSLSGTSKFRVQAEFPLHKTLDMSEVDWRAEGASKNAASSQEIKGHTISKADVDIRVDPTQLSITGKGVLDGLLADIDLLLPLGGSSVKGRQDVVLDVSAKQLKQRGVDLTAFLSGPMTMTVEDADGQKAFDIDLTRTRVRLDALGWEKARGVPANVKFLLAETDDNRKVRDFELTSDGVDIAGSLTLTAKGDLETASFSKFQLRNGDNASLTISRSGAGRYKIAMTGEEFDARGLIRRIRQPAAAGDSSTFSNGLAITANVSRVKGFNGVTIQGFAGVIGTDSEGLTAADVTGLLNGRAPFSFELDDAPGGNGRLAEGAFDDSGALLKFLDLYERMRGGKGRLSVAMAEHTTWDGTFNVTGLSITEDPAIQKLSERGDLLQGKSQGAVVLSGGTGGGGEASFDTLDVAFTRKGNTVTITRGALQGAVLGGTVSGAVNLTSQTMDLTGTFVPIYALNNIFSKIPILGFALGGGSGEGLIGVTYRLSGALSDPVLSVNPISAIAPGIFRKMFEFQ